MTCGAQGTSLRLHVLDSVSGAGIQAVTVMDRGGLPLGITDEGGECVVSLGKETCPLVLRHISYGTRRVECPAGPKVTVHWAMPAMPLPVAEVYDRSVPEVVMKHDRLDVAEFEITDEGIWVLAYGRPRMVRSEGMAGRTIYRDVTLFLLDTLWTEQASVPVMGDVLALHRDFHGNVYIEAPGAAYACLRSGRSILLEHIDRTTLSEAILPWTDTVPGWLIGNNDRRDFYAFDHFAHDPATRDTRVFCTAEDPFTRELFRSQYKYMNGHDKVVAMDLALRSGIDKQIIAGYMTGFQHDRYFHPPYAPLFIVHDTLCVFDHSCGAIRKFTRDLQPCDETPFTYHLRNLWCGELVQDPVGGEVYLLEHRGPVATVRPVDTGSGSAGRSYALTHRHPEQVVVHAGFAYYTYRPFGSEQTRWLYRERIR